MKTFVLTITILVISFDNLGLAGVPRQKAKYVCHYDRKTVTWTPCNKLTNKKTMVMSLKPGQPAKCQPLQTLELPCTTAQGKRRCAYDSGKFHLCNPATGRRAQVRTLLPGSDADCPKILRKEMPCKVSRKDAERQQRLGNRQAARHVKCLYRVTNQLACDPVKKSRILKMKLTKASPRSCKPEKTMTLPCRTRDQAYLLKRLPTSAATTGIV